MNVLWFLPSCTNDELNKNAIMIMKTLSNELNTMQCIVEMCVLKWEILKLNWKTNGFLVLCQTLLEILWIIFCKMSNRIQCMLCFGYRKKLTVINLSNCDLFSTDVFCEAKIQSETIGIFQSFEKLCKKTNFSLINVF